MNFQDLESLLSESRLGTYYKLFPTNKEKAVEYYLLNTQISESFYPLLSTLEIVLRNSIHTSFSIHFKSYDWFSKFTQPELLDQVNVAKRKVLRSCSHITPDKIIAELTLGFWASLFYKQYAKYFWKPLMHIFPLINPLDKHRDKIAYKLDQTRRFRNRIFHYEPICNDLNVLAKNHNNILDILNWINGDIVTWTKQVDRFNNLYRQAVYLRSI
jgi:hypothetical protein